MEVDPDGRHDEAAAEAQRGDEHRAPPGGGRALDPASEQGGRQPKYRDRDRKRSSPRRQLPIRRVGMSDADQPGQRQVVGREGVCLPDAQMHRHGQKRAPESGCSRPEQRCVPCQGRIGACSVKSLLVLFLIMSAICTRHGKVARWPRRGAREAAAAPAPRKTNRRLRKP